ncbi:hypothetical protein K0M31_008503 [Melipona bicolor]|uniref:Secreted protein n=1 Tax=Melipona bicolor TaxID=60889 RepID=A0AA40FRS8_9HYME|nr:hypothetical protein K0M31_008503 [Melipona bicolor]
MEFRGLLVWVVEVMAAATSHEEGRKEAAGKEQAAHTCGGQEPRCLDEVDPVFRLITSPERLLGPRLDSTRLDSLAFRPNKGPGDDKSSDRLLSSLPDPTISSRPQIVPSFNV